MKFTALDIPGLVVVEPDVHVDNRGFFFESYNKEIFAQNGVDVQFVQDNHSKSSKGVLRGLHFQVPPYAQDKLIRVTKGKVLDVAVDIRRSSSTYGKWVSVELDEDNKKMLFIPKGFAHGFLCLSEVVEFEYKVSGYYNAENSHGIMWNDPDLAIEWPVQDPVLSEKDKGNFKFKDLPEFFE